VNVLTDLSPGDLPGATEPVSTAPASMVYQGTPAPSTRPPRPRGGRKLRAAADLAPSAPPPPVAPLSPPELAARWGLSKGRAELACERMRGGCPERVAVAPKAAQGRDGAWRAAGSPDTLEGVLRLYPWAARLRWDAFHERVELRPPTDADGGGAAPGAAWAPWSDELAAGLRADLAAEVGATYTADDVRVYARRVAMERPVHPVRDWLRSLRWDGRPRLATWLHRYFACPDEPLYREMGTRWLVSAVARVMQPGCKADCMLVLAGPQGAGKSRSLAALGGAWFCDASLRMDGDKDGAILLRGRWVWEVAELASLHRGSLEAVKAYLSRPTDVYRPPYGTEPREVPRQTVFAGTVNPEEGGRFLADRTGNRRFWLVPVNRSPRDPVPVAALEAERGALFAEAVALYDAGADWWLPAALEGVLATAQEDAQGDVDPWAPLVAAWARGLVRAADGTDPAPVLVTTADVACHALHLPKDRLDTRAAGRIRACMAALGAKENAWRRPDGLKVRCWRLPDAMGGDE